MSLKKIFTSVLIVAWLGSLVGCASTVTKADKLKQFGAGESTLYIINRAVNKDLSKWACDGKKSGKEEEEYLKKEICPNFNNLQAVSGFYYTHPFKGLKFTAAYAPKSMEIGVDDILKLSMNLGPDGDLLRPPLVVKVAKKANAKEPADCYWEGGTYATTAFLSGGVVCEGWDWKKQKFSQ